MYGVLAPTASMQADAGHDKLGHELAGCEETCGGWETTAPVWLEPRGAKFRAISRWRTRRLRTRCRWKSPARFYPTTPRPPLCRGRDVWGKRCVLS